MSDNELYSLLCSYQTTSHHQKLSQMIKTSDRPATTSRCIKQVFHLLKKMCDRADAVGVSQLTMVLGMLLPYKNYQIVDEGVIQSIKTLHTQFRSIRKTHYLYKIYTSYLQIISDLLEAKLDFYCKVTLSHTFGTVLFNIGMVDDNILAYDLRMEAVKCLNGMLEEEGKTLHEFILKHPDVNKRWLNIGDAVKNAGDFELQVILMELLCRLLSPTKRKKHADMLFSEPDLQELMLSINDGDFEKDCRILLNTLNEGLQQRMVYSFRCTRVSTGTEDLEIPQSQNWLDINFGSKTMTIFVTTRTDEGTEYDTLIINPKNVLKYEHTVSGTSFHLVLKLDTLVSRLLHSGKGGQSKALHFVLDNSPCPKGAVLGLLGQHLPTSPDQKKTNFRVAVTKEAVHICGNTTTIVATPKKDPAERFSQTKQLLAENKTTKPPSPPPPFEMGSSQPEKRKVRSVISVEPIVTNPRAPKIVPTNTYPEANIIPDSLPVSVIPDTQRALQSKTANINLPGSNVGAENDQQWKLQSSFDYTSRLNESEISVVGDDTMKDLVAEALDENKQQNHAHDSITKSETMDTQLNTNGIDDKKSRIPKIEKVVDKKSRTPKIEKVVDKKSRTPKIESVEDKKSRTPKIAKVEDKKSRTPKIAKVEDKKSRTPKLKSVDDRKSRKLVKKPLTFANVDDCTAVIKVGGTKQTSPIRDDVEDIPLNNDPEMAIKIQNNFDKSKPESGDDLVITNVVAEEEVMEVENVSDNNEMCDDPEESSQDGAAHSPMSSSQQLDQLNYSIANNMPSSPGEVYRNMLAIKKEKSKDSPLSTVGTNPKAKYKRKLMDTDETFLLSQDEFSQETMSISQVRKVPLFARKKLPANMNSSSSFIISKNKALQSNSNRTKEIIPEEIVPNPPVRQSILKRKFLDKSQDAPKTPKFDSFCFDERSPVSDKSWIKTHRKKKRTAGFKTKKQKLEEERIAKRKIKEENKKNMPAKKLTKKRLTNEIKESTDEDGVEIERQSPKLKVKEKSPSPTPPHRATRYSMRRSTAIKKVNYRDLNSDEETKSVSVSDFSTTTTSTFAKAGPFKASKRRQPSPEPEPEDMFDILNRSISDKRSEEVLKSCKEEGENKHKAKKRSPPSEVIKDVKQSFDRVFSQSSQESLQEKKTISPHISNAASNNAIPTTTSIDIATISAQYDGGFSPTKYDMDELQVTENVTVIPSTDKVGIPFSMASNIPSIPSLESKDPSPIIKSNILKLPKKEARSIRLDLIPKIKTVSPLIYDNEINGEEMTERVELNGDNIENEMNKEGDLETVQRMDEEELSRQHDDAKILSQVFDEQILENEEIYQSKLRGSRKNYSQKNQKNRGKQKADKKISLHNKQLDILQESFDKINTSTVLEISDVTVSKLSDVQRYIIEEEPEKVEKLWLAGSDSGSASSYPSKLDPINNITSKAISDVTAAQMTVQFNEVSNCMITEADSSGMMMEIEDYSTPECQRVQEDEVENIFSRILEESRLASVQSPTRPVSSALVSTPTKSAHHHIKRAEKENVSPFYQYLQKIGDIKSPIKDSKIVKRDKYALSTTYDSGLGVSALQTSASVSLHFANDLQLKQPKRRRLKSPVNALSVTLPISPTKISFGASQSPGKAELEDYYKMLCKTPSKTTASQSQSSPTRLPASQISAAREYTLPELTYSPLRLDVCEHGGDSKRDNNTDEHAEAASGASFSETIPQYMLNSQSGIVLQMLQNQKNKLREKQRQKSRHTVDFISTEITTASHAFFNSHRSKRRSVLATITREMEEEIDVLEKDLKQIKAQEEDALKSIARAHKLQRDARISLENKFKLLKEKTRRDSNIDQELGSLSEMRMNLQSKLESKQKLQDRDQVQEQRKQLMKQVAAMLMCSELE